MKPLNVFVCLIASTVFLLSGSAMATDRKVYSGSMCQPFQSGDAGSLVLDTVGAHNSSTTNAINVTCPIVRDNTQNTNGTNLAFINAKSSGGGTITCVLISRDQNGIGIASKVASTNSSTAVGLDLHVNASAVLGSYTIACTLPPGGLIINYDIDEF